MRSAFVSFALFLAFLLISPGATAHGMRTAYLEVVENAPGSAVVSFKSTFSDPLVVPTFPEGCTSLESHDGSTPTAKTWVVSCDGPLGGRSLGVGGLGPVLTEAVVRVSLHDGTQVSEVLTEAHPSFVVYAQRGALATLGAYLLLGLSHIATGPDHLLFLFALVLYLKRTKAIFAAETAFTVSHTASYSATALGLIHLPSRAAEACIALSLALLSAEILKPRNGAPSTLSGASCALVFGLVHGLGFAGGLTEMGMPDGAAASALAGFGLGVELGQVVFLVGALLLVRALSKRVESRHLTLVGSYAVGVLGTFWFLQRLWTCFA